MKIFVISTPNDPNRAANVEHQFASQKMTRKYELVSAEMNPSQPSVGILRSFKKCIQKAVSLGENEVLILEDDFVCLSPYAIQEIISVYFTNPVQNGILLGGFYEGNPVEINDEIAQIHGKLAGLHAIIVPKQHFQTILDAEEGYHLDYTLSMIAKIPIYSLYPMQIVQRDGFSYNANAVTHYTEELHRKYKIYGK